MNDSMKKSNISLQAVPIWKSSKFVTDIIAVINIRAQPGIC